MAFEVLSSEQAFGEGDEIWFVPDQSHSSWEPLLDWYLNFQFHSARDYKPPQLGQEILEILAREDLPFGSGTYPTERKLAPLLVASSQFFPNRNTVRVPYQNSAEEWLQRVKKISEGLKAKSVRVFYPNTADPRVLGKAWGSDGPELRLVGPRTGV